MRWLIAWIVLSAAACLSEPLSAQVQDEALMAKLEASRAPILAAAAEIDRLVQANWQKHNVQPSLPANDQIFMRRAYLDITGTIPTGQEALNFLDANRKNKRQVLIDQLLTSDGYVSHYYNYWADVLRVKSSVDNVELHGYVEWIKESLRKNKPYDEFAYELLTAAGRPWENGAVGYYLRDQGMPLDNLSNTVAIFLGTQVGCAQCHDHPFERWTQQDFYQLAAFTYGIDLRAGGKDIQAKRREVDAEAKRRSLTARQQQLVAQLARYNQWDVQDSTKTVLRYPKDYDYDNAKPDEIVTPQTIFGDQPTLKDRESRRAAFAHWVTSEKNPLFAKVIANRLWKQLMGVGLIEPLDDIEGAEASNPELLEFLTSQMIRMDFNLKQFIRMVMNTDVYQRRAVSKEIEEEAYHFPGPTLRRMSAEQIWDALVTLSMDDPLAIKYDESTPYRFPYYDLRTISAKEIVDRGVALYAEREKPKTAPAAASNKPAGPSLARASEMRQPAPPGHFLRDFGQSDRELIDGANQNPTVSQILTLINGRHHYQIVRDGSILMEHLKQVEGNEKLRMRVIYLSILGREPSSLESRLALNIFEEFKTPKRGNTELIWILLNTPEFMFIQ